MVTHKFCLVRGYWCNSFVLLLGYCTLITFAYLVKPLVKSQLSPFEWGICRVYCKIYVPWCSMLQHGGKKCCFYRHNTSTTEWVVTLEWTPELWVSELEQGEIWFWQMQAMNCRMAQTLYIQVDFSKKVNTMCFFVGVFLGQRVISVSNARHTLFNSSLCFSILRI